MLGPFATASRRYIAIHQVSLLSHASAGGVRCRRRRRRRRRQRQRVTEGTAMAPGNGPNNIKTCKGLPVEESIRMTEKGDKWRKYVNGVPTVGSRMTKEQNRTEQSLITQMALSTGCGNKKQSLRKNALS